MHRVTSVDLEALAFHARTMAFNDVFFVWTHVIRNTSTIESMPSMAIPGMGSDDTTFCPDDKR